MPAFLKLGDIKGSSAHSGEFKDLMELQSVSHAITRSIQSGSRGAQRHQGSTTLGDIHIVKTYDKASTLIAEATALGKYFPTAEITLASVHNKKLVPNHKIKLKDVIISSYSFHGTHDSNPPHSEEFTLSHTSAELTHKVVDKEGNATSEVPGKYDLEQ